MPDINLITILGPTASGKTLLGAHLAYHLNGEIISADSRQVYKKMNIGTGKDYDDYIVYGKKIAYHLVDMHNPGYKYNVYEYQRDFIKAYSQISGRGKLPLLVGGSGMYIQAVLDNYQLIRVPVNTLLRNRLKNKSQDELVSILKSYHTDLHNTTDLLQRKRTIRAIEIADHYKQHPKITYDYPDLRTLIFGLEYDRQSIRKRITKRLHTRLQSGMIEEVAELLKSVNSKDLIFYGLEYKLITFYLQGELTYEEMIFQLEIAIHQFAKRQVTWFRRMERSGFKIHWINGQSSLEYKLENIYTIIKSNDKQLIKRWKK